MRILCWFGIHSWFDALPGTVHRHLECSRCKRRTVIKHKEGYSPVAEGWGSDK